MKDKLKKKLVQAIKSGDTKLAKILADKYARIINIEVYGNQKEK